jgi:thiamine kinase-like enzyme
MPDLEKVVPTDLAPLADILEQLIPMLGMLEGGAAPLEGGITNRNYVARFDGRSYVIRLPGKDTGQLEIDRQTEREANEAAARAGVGPAVAAMLADPPCLVTHFVEGAEMSAGELREPAALEAVAGLLRRLHGSGETVASAFSAFRIVETYAARAEQRGAEVPAGYAPAHATAARIEAAIDGLGEAPVLCHDDLLAANFLSSAEDGIQVVDWEYAGMGSRYFDLGNFAVNNELDPGQEDAFLAAYFGEPARPRQLAALGLMRFMSDFREAMWGVLQGSLSDLDFDFAAYAAKHFGRLAEAEADPRLDAWIEDASGAAS